MLQATAEDSDAYSLQFLQSFHATLDAPIRSPVVNVQPPVIDSNGFLSWDPWGDDAEIYSGGFWSQTTRIPSDQTDDGANSGEQSSADASEAHQEIREEREDPAEPERSCIVCLDDVPTNLFPKLPHAISTDNEHSSDVCFDCWDNHLMSNIKSSGYQGVSCPQCSQRLSETEVRKVAKASTYVEYVLTPEQ